MLEGAWTSGSGGPSPASGRSTSPRRDARRAVRGASRCGSTTWTAASTSPARRASRDWYANLRAHPDFTFHLKESVRADLPARATPILETTRAPDDPRPHPRGPGARRDLDAWVRESPLVEVTIVEDRPAEQKGATLMAVRTSDAEWKGDLRQGKGTMRLGSGAFEGAYSFPSRFEDGAGTNPEELIAAAHAGCFSMALAAGLSRAGHPPTRIHTQARVHLERQGEGFAITRIELVDRGPGPGPERRGLPDAGRERRRRTARCRRPSPGPRSPSRRRW